MSSRLPAHLHDPKALAAFSHRLERYAHACLGRRSRADAEDLTQRALTRALDPAGPEWDQLKEPDFARWVAGIVDGLAGNVRKKARRHPEVELEEAALVAMATPSPEVALAGHEARSVLLAKLEARCDLPRDADLLKFAALIAEGHDSRIEQAKALGCGMSAIVLLRRRLIRKLKELRPELEDLAS